MIDPVVTKALSKAILMPVINTALLAAKKIGIAGLDKWEQTKYHSKIQKKISSIESLKTFWSQDKLVALHDFYYPPRIQIANETKHYQFLSELPEGNLIIEGIVGQGKSIYLRHLATSEIRSNQSKFFPIFIEFRTLTPKINIEIAIKNYLDDVNIDGFDEKTFEFVMSSGKFVLLLDAFDELDDAVTKETYMQIERYIEKYEELKIIITSRPSAEIQKSTKFKTIKLNPLNENDYTPFLRKLNLDSSFIAEIKRSIKSSPSKISHLIKTPLMLTLVVRAYSSVKEIPENLPDFFEVLFKCVFSGHDKAKPFIKRPLATGLSEKKIQELFEAFCFVCIKNKITRGLTTEHFDQYFESAKKLLTEIKCEASEFRDDMNKVTCLILPDGFDTWVFLHKSVLEYYAASFIKKSNEDFAKKFFQHAMKDPFSWGEVLTFSNYIDEYRFNKHYLLKELDEVLSTLDFPNNEPTLPEILNYLKENGVDPSITIRTEPDPLLEDLKLSLGFEKEKLKFCTKNIIHTPLFNFIQGIAEEKIKITDEKFLNFLKKSSNEKNEITMNLEQSLKLYSDDNFIIDFKVFMNKLQEKNRIASENIQLHESRCKFLDD